MTVDAVRQQVLGILASNDVPVQTYDDGTFGVPAPAEDSSAFVIISVNEEYGEALISLRSPVLSEVDVGGRKTAKILQILNGLNCGHTLCKWALYEEQGIVGCEYDLLGGHLQESELMTALIVIASTADNCDDALIDEIGSGRRALENDGAVA